MSIVIERIVPTDNLDTLKKAVNRINKGYRRSGLVEIELTIGEPYDEVQAGSNEMVTRHKVVLTAPEPVINGWRFIATLEHIHDAGVEETIVNVIENNVLPVQYRNAGPACEHCGYKRLRRNTYVVTNTKNPLPEYKQVGKSCLCVFLGHEKAEKVADSAEWLAEASEALEEASKAPPSGKAALCVNGRWSHRIYLAFVAKSMRDSGWKSRREAYQKNKRGSATADMAFSMMQDYYNRIGSENPVPVEHLPTVADREVASKAIEWALSLDNLPEGGSGDYLHNLRAIARAKLVEKKMLGIAGSTIFAMEIQASKEKRNSFPASSEPAPALPGSVGHIGTEGQVGTFTLVVKRVKSYSSTSHWHWMESTNGNKVLYKARRAEETFREGEVVTLEAKVLSNGFYGGVPQTEIANVKRVVP